jgi:acyl-coenzyme A synthetase/AMP-(fatty) acid ligase
MGYRIELEEIENAMVRLPNINEAAVFAVEDKNNNKIVGVFESSVEIDLAELKAELKKYLPSYMIPAEFKRIDRLSKNANGKTDRRAIKEKFLEQWQK